MTSNKITKLVTAALMATMTCIATMIIPIPIPFSSTGYIHPGDAFVLLSGIILGPVYGGLAAGIGSMLADLLAGYTLYAGPTFIIKALAALLGALVYKHIRIRPIIFAGIMGGIVVTLGYFLYEFFSFGFAAAIINVPFNIIQNAFAIVLTSLLFPLLRKTPQIRSMMDE